MVRNVKDITSALPRSCSGQIIDQRRTKNLVRKEKREKLKTKYMMF